MYIRRSEDVQDVFGTSYVRSIYILCLLGDAYLGKTASLIFFCYFRYDGQIGSKYFNWEGYVAGKTVWTEIATRGVL